METKSKIIIGSFIGAIIILIISFLISGNLTLNDLTPTFLEGIVSASSENPKDTRQIGYEFLDNGDVVHIWNNATISDYYFEKDSGIQLTNHYQDYWSRNIFCIGYYNNDEWNKIACADELTNFERSIETDNLTYVNATLWKDIEYNEYDLRLGVQYHLGLNDENLSITIYGKNIGIDIPFDLGFAWKVTDLNVPEENNDNILINNSYYSLDDTFDLTFKNMTNIYFNYILNETREVRDNETGEIIVNGSTEIIGNETIIEKIPYFKVYDYDNSLRLHWDENLNYTVKMYGDGNQKGFYVATLINAGHFNPNQEKSTTFKWVDLTDKNWYVNLSINASLTDIGDWSAPSVFFMDESWYMIASEYDGLFNGYVYNEVDKDWDTNTTIVTGLLDVGTFGAQTVFFKDETWYLIAGQYNGDFDGYRWSGSSWVANATIKSGLGDLGLDSTPSVAYYENQFFLVAGLYIDGIDDPHAGYTMAANGTTWVFNSTIIDSLPSFGTRTIPYIFEKNGTLYAFMNNATIGETYYRGYELASNGSTWLRNSVINASLPHVLTNALIMFPSVYFKNAAWNLLSGNTGGTFQGYTYYEEGIPVIYELNITNPNSTVPESVSSGDNITISFNFTADNVTQTTGVTMENVTIGGSNAPIWGTDEIIGDIPWFVGAGAIAADASVPIALTLTCPTYQENDILIASWYNTGGDPITVSTGDWTEIDSLVSTDDAGWFWQRAAGGGTAGGTFTSVDDDAFIICYVIRGATTDGDPFDTGWATANNLSSSVDTATPNTMPITTLGSNRVVFHFMNINDNVASWSVSPAPSPWVLNDDETSTTGTDARLTAISKNVSNEGIVSSVIAGTLGAVELQAGLTIAFKPVTTLATEELAFYDSFWQVNVSVPTFESGLKDLFVNATYDGNIRNDTETGAIDYGGGGDTCTYTSGNWNVDCSDDCFITENVNAAGNDIVLYGTGTFNILANITADSIAWEKTCNIINEANDGKWLIIAS